MAHSIKIFQFVQKFDQFFGHPYNPHQQQRAANSAGAIFLIGLAQYMCETAAFLVFNAKSMFDYGFVSFTIITIINSAVLYVILVWQSENTLNFFKNCEGFIAKRVHSAPTYIELIEKIELINKLIFFGVCAAVASFLVTVVPYSFVRYYIFHMGEESFYLFVPAWFPFNWKTPFGYVVAWLAQSTGLSILAHVLIQFENLVFGSCWLFIGIVKDITQDVVAFNTFAKAASPNNRIGMTKRFCDIVQIYTDAKQCISEFNQIFQYSLFEFFPWNMLAAASMLVAIQFELWDDNPILLELGLLVLTLVYTNLLLFLFCEPGERVSNQLEEFNDELNQCDWYLLPIELQRLYIIFILDTQNPIAVMSYANIVCGRNTMKKIINTTFSYFMTLRKFKV